MVLLLIGLSAILLFNSFHSRTLLRVLTTWMEKILAIDIAHVILKTTLILVMMASLASLLFYLFPVLQRFVFFLPNNYIFAVLGARAGILLAWVFLLSLQLILLYLVSGRKAAADPPVQMKLMAICWLAFLFILVLFGGWSLFSGKLSLSDFIGPGSKVLALSIWFSIWTLLNRNKNWAARIYQPFIVVSLFLSIFLVSLQFNQWFNIWGPRPDDQLILLADSFLHGKLYYINVPYYTHDMNFVNGLWYQPRPPFPIILIMPFVAIWGVHGFNINTFALILSALTAVIIYLIICRLKQSGWIKLNRSGAIWLTVLFEFGTVFWWLSIEGTSGFFCQLVTVLFSALAFLIVLKRGSPWLAGICLAAAVMSRPNVFVLWPALVCITIQLKSEEGKVDWSKIFRWGVSSAVPGVLGAGLLLYYNFLRFGTFSDFGYGTLKGAARYCPKRKSVRLVQPAFYPHQSPGHVPGSSGLDQTVRLFPPLRRWDKYPHDDTCHHLSVPQMEFLLVGERMLDFDPAIGSFAFHVFEYRRQPVWIQVLNGLFRSGHYDHCLQCRGESVHTSEDIDRRQHFRKLLRGYIHFEYFLLIVGPAA